MFLGTMLAIGAFAVATAAAFAMTEIEARTALSEVYAQRPDLQKFFLADGAASAGSPYAASLPTLETWARRYGWKEFPDQLSWYSPGPAALMERPAAKVPVRSTQTTFSSSAVTSSSWMVVDAATRKVLLEMGPRTPHPLASITKLMTAMTAIDNGLPMNGTFALQSADNVGGATLKAPSGTVYSVRDLFDAMLVGSANNAAYAVARASGLEKEKFIAAMNAKADALGLADTVFVDPSGLEVENTSTARDIAALGFNAFDVYDIRRATTTAKATLTSGPGLHTIKNTNGLLTDSSNGLLVQGGKTGYLIESKWNLVVKMRGMNAATQPPLLVVVLGSGSQKQSFVDAETLARWTWKNYAWQKP
jgi:serine-type D-Ala-D-Ala endopeptidase (penicillin-binding protein 7)